MYVCMCVCVCVCVCVCICTCTFLQDSAGTKNAAAAKNEPAFAYACMYAQAYVDMPCIHVLFLHRFIVSMHACFIVSVYAYGHRTATDI